MFDVLKGDGRKWISFLRWWQRWWWGSLCLCSVYRQVDSQMATPSADPCLALADAQLAPGAEHAGCQARPSEEICGQGDHMASVTSQSHSSPLSVSPP